MPAPGAQYESSTVTNPFEERRVSAFTASEIATLQSRLNKQLGPEYISHRTGAGGSKVAYLEGTKAIALANDVFGFNGWSSSLQQVQVDYVDEHQGGRINLGLSIVVRVTLKDGTYHEDIGYGMIENAKGKGAAFEKAKKEAATDGLKRALRNFGNVLGNCLYDKEYLKKVNTMKVKPVAFDENRLHRHPDFRARIKEEEQQQQQQQQAMVKVEQQTPVRPGASVAVNQAVPALQQSASSITAEFEDEFGGNLFDGVEISEHHGDEFTFETVDSAPKAVEAGEASTRNSANPPQRQSINRMQSMPAMRAGTPAGPPQRQNQAPSRPTPPPVSNGRGPQNSNVQQNNGPPKPMPQQQQQHNQPPRTTPPNQMPQKPNGQQPNQQPNDKPAIGFTTSRAAELMQNPEAISNLPAFNPHAESPLPKHQRTPGIDHTRSRKITRESVGVPTPPIPQQQQPGQQPQPQPQPSQGGNNQFRPMNPQNRSNFVNPHQDSNRRIGMPGAHAMSPLANRGSYKPPGPVGGIKRPPLADVSNQNGTANPDGPPDSKKVKLETGTTTTATENVPNALPPPPPAAGA